jgi:LacI family transcriptional regulator/LacI family repressor for deo operon, udp, cdd, tsx, nupC, and nupG
VHLENYMEKQSSQSRISIKDIARAAGVSHSTVSRALHDSPLISQATRQRIQALAADMGYIPDAIAQSLQTQRTGTLGLVVTSIADPFFADLIGGVEEVAATAGMSVLVSASHIDPEREIEIIETFDRRRVDGIIIASSRLGSRYTQRLARIHVPVVLINKHAEEDDVPNALIHSITVDDRGGAHLAMAHLLKLGHARIGYLGMGNRLLSNRNRYTGYREALHEAGLAPQPDWAVIAPSHNQHDVMVGQRLFPQLWDVGVSAVFCYNDRVAIGVLMACRARDIAVPADCSVVGFDNIEYAQYMTPPLTTVHQPKREMGQLAMRMILDLLEDETVENQVLLPTLMERESSAARGR